MKRKSHLTSVVIMATMISLSGYAAVPVEADDLEHDAVGSAPTKPTVLNPATPATGALVQVVDTADNIAGTGKGLRLQDDNAGTSVQVQYEFTRIADVPPDASIPNGLSSAVRVDLSLAPLSTTVSKGDYFNISLGEFDANLLLPTKRFIDCQLWDNGSMDFVSSSGPDSTGNMLTAASNTLSIFLNDYQQNFTYTGPDDNPYVLPANAVAYWLNGSLIDFGGQDYTLMENKTTANGTISTSSDNIGRFGIVSEAGDVGLDYVIDDILVTDLGSEQTPTNTSWLVQNSSTGLVYAGYANEGQVSAVNTVPDFSNVGYKGGGVPIPFVPAAVTVSPGPGDDRAAIQSAIDTVSGMSIGPDGFRGAVVLEAGEYEVSSTLNISASGVVVRGAGSGESGGTRITYTATTQSDLFLIDGGSVSPAEIGGTRVDITTSFVPVGATSFDVSNASGYAPGDAIIVQNTVNQQWLLDMSDMTQYGWTTGGYQLLHRRTVTAVSGNTITIDAPIVQTIEDQYGGGDIYKYTFSGELENVGIESMRLESTYASDTDENHGWDAVEIEDLRNGWVRQVTARYFGHGCVNIPGNSRHITVEDCAMLDHKGTTAGGRRYSFSIDDSDSIMMQRCLTRNGRHDFASGSKTPGPNVFVDCRATETINDIGPHHRYSTGQLYDNIMGGEMNVQNRTTSGSGHGWAGAQIMFWNCDNASIVCDAPNGAMNWSVGNTAVKRESHRSPSEPFGIWDSENQAVTPRSLYYTQLADRLGVNALNKIILPEQKAANVWSELFLWDGDGVFGDDVVTWVDEETVAEANVPVAIGGTVRKLVMLDRGVTYSWSKVSGLGSVAFGDDTALETTATFSQEGSYVLELTVDDGVSPASSMLSIQIGEGTPDTDPPAAPANLAATADDGVVSLNWDDNGEPDLDSYSVFRSTTSESYGTALATGLTSSEYVDNSVTNGTTYYYVVSAVDINTNESAQSAEVSATPEPDTTPPAVPTGLAAVAGDNLVSLNWDDNGEPDLDTYSIYRSDTSGSYGAALATGLTSSDYVDNSVVNGTTYYYVVSAVDINTNESAQSTEVSATPQADAAPPAAPAGLAATAGDNSVTLEWDDNGEGDLGSYSVYRSTASGSYGAALATGLTSSDYVDNAVINGTTYYYVVSAVDISANESTQSAEVSATPQAGGGGSQTLIVYGSNNDGLGGFTQSTTDGNASWSELTDSVKYTNDGALDGGTRNSSFLRAFTLDRSNGNSYTVEGVVQLTDGYADDNNRVGIYLFGDTAEVPNEDEAGAIGLIFNTDDGFTGGSPGDNSDDNLGLRVGIDNTALSAVVPRNESGTVAYAQDLFGTEITLTADITFTNIGGTDSIEIVGTLTDFNDVTTTASATVTAADYTGDWFGFVTRARSRGTDTRTAPWIMDYRSFSVSGGAAPLEGYALWASGWGTEIGGSAYDFDLDGLVNLYEYGVDGDPTDDLDQGTLPTLSNSAGTLVYVHPKRSDDSSLIYTVETTTNLVSGIWTADGYTVEGTDVTGGTLDYVTNNVDTAESERFIRLRIEQ